MATENPIRMVESESFTKVLRESNVRNEQIRTVPSRSGSAPPTIEGSIAAIRTFMKQRNSTILTSCNNEFLGCESEEEMRTDPAYIAYYYANVNLNPRLPPPLISRESRHMVKLMGSFGSKKLGSVTEGVLATHREEPYEDMSSQQTLGLVDLIQGDVPQVTSSTAFKEENDHESRIVSTTTTTQILGTQESHSSSVDNVSIQTDIGSDITVESRMKSLNISGVLVMEDNQKRLDNLHLHDENRLHFDTSRGHAYPGIHSFHGAMEKFSNVHPKILGMQPLIHNPGLIPPLYATAAAYMNSGNLLYAHLQQPGFHNLQFSTGGFSPTSVFHPPVFGGYLQDNAIGKIDPYTGQMTYMNKNYGHELMMPPFLSGPLQGQYYHQPGGQFDVNLSRKDSDIATLIGDKGLNHPSNGNFSISPPTNRSQINVNHYGYSPTLVPGYPMGRSNHPGRVNDWNVSPYSPKNGAAFSRLEGQKGYYNADDSKRCSFLELLKSCNSRKLELSDISGKIVKFSTDQHGSRYIQQKLENCSIDEKESVFKEVFPHASRLMTDVFGNYVIQKFFEHGTAEQRRKLGEQLKGQILTLSLQMYGCRVIQKALEVIELDQKVVLVNELEGHVMRCVHDQNGNHVIQKCIESIPAERIGFILSSFHGQVSTLSSHPYGCRVIQRILEHCSDEKICQCIVDEILESASILAQDPYGNYVTQHVLEMGKPHERSQIIRKLTGNFVQMSQHKYASNVVEKCLKYGDASERDLIIEEIIAKSDSDDALLTMMKDQFANYVVQKMFEIGSDKQREILLDCVRTHLPVLKRFTYAKHIVIRYEQVSEGLVQEQK